MSVARRGPSLSKEPARCFSDFRFNPELCPKCFSPDSKEVGQPQVGISAFRCLKCSHVELVLVSDGRRVCRIGGVS